MPMTVRLRAMASEPLPAFRDILVERRDDGIAIVTFNRPERMNAFSRLTGHEVEVALEHLAADDAVRALILTGKGRGFCAGADASGYEVQGDALDSPHLRANRGRRAWMTPLFVLAHAIYDFPKPVVGAINGAAVGMGMGLALACDVRIVAQSARFNTMFVARGLASDFGLAFTLKEIVGRSKALELIWNHPFVSSQEALELGIANRVVQDEELLPASIAFLEPALEAPPLAIETAKLFVNFRSATDFREYIDFEETPQLKLKDKSEDTRELRNAQKEGRKPVYRGR